MKPAQDMTDMSAPAPAAGHHVSGMEFSLLVLNIVTDATAAVVPDHVSRSVQCCSTSLKSYA